ncbi:MAG: 30S ribosomal protein S20 [Candidatus Gracilibacteria bacterium]|nr:30S ribosomal protein S20 [Candidatus Gracilibacteria bacterium]MDQ7022862.1 30S ribosomal protein S20 [Candidatus Gracilibacteria bacterium]
MPIIQGAKKALRVSRKKQVRNTHIKNIYNELRRAFEKAIKSNEGETANAVWFNKKEDGKNVKSGLQSTIDKLVKKNLIHKNNGARKKAKFAKMLKEISISK